ncbi:hypothetical protein [Magnetospirillum sulfuroxidans]|uniref:Periplasmic protein TonB n=1 Tax=Magnetospirillum sulfuroxidans TaxID=611300 RepID=A0ABS5IF02_9PROT|nr:hypothetical protein [Magnetospirillum sulfuroxidans]MBR9972904.1 hypothetical protein [Magnetospirillum sulfuroxidans]
MKILLALLLGIGVALAYRVSQEWEKLDRAIPKIDALLVGPPTGSTTTAPAAIAARDEQVSPAPAPLPSPNPSPAAGSPVGGIRRTEAALPTVIAEKPIALPPLEEHVVRPRPTPRMLPPPAPDERPVAEVQRKPAPAIVERESAYTPMDIQRKLTSASSVLDGMLRGAER